MKSLTRHIKEIGLQLGFDKVGVCPALPALHFDFFKSWIENGYNGTMRYLARSLKERQDPAQLLPDARSIIVCLVNYFPGEAAEDLFVARYARGQDYHDHIPLALEELGGRIEALRRKPVRWKVFCDTSPVLERNYAAASGIGWIGKNTCLISDIGSWTFIGGLILDLELDYDRAMEDRCGTCKLCLEACPTGALVEPFLLDARRCLSYLTIEHKGEIDGQNRHAMGDKIFGCDRCQEVCPYNKGAPPTNWKAFKKNSMFDRLNLQILKAMDEQKFNTTFAKSPLLYAGYNKIQRNLSLLLSPK